MTIEEAFEITSPTRAIAAGYSLALHELDATAVELRRFQRGLINADAAHDQIEFARRALRVMEAALKGCSMQQSLEE
jgi:hypothetical protein